jgi:RNA polymerase sigma-70 factor (ECF subfamily)
MLPPTEDATEGPACSMEQIEPLADEEIVQRVLAGDLAAFELIMRRYNQRLFRAARSILGNDDEAEDVLQDAYVRAFEHLSQFAGRAKFSTWLTRIAVHEALARRRRRRIRYVDLRASETLGMAPVSRDRNAQEELGNRELGCVLRQAIDGLPEDLRVVFTLRAVEGLNTDEAAECLGLTPSNVKVRLHRARAALREEVEDRMGAELRQVYQFDGARCDRIVRSVLERLARR